MIKLSKSKRILANGEERLRNCVLHVSEGVEIECFNEIMSYIELQDKILVLINWFQAQNLYDYDQGNIFCYDKSNGELLWQAESFEDSPYVGVYLEIGDGKGGYLSDSESGVIMEGSFGEIIRSVYDIKIFDVKNDRIVAGTPTGYAYELDINTGQATEIGYTK